MISRRQLYVALLAVRLLLVLSPGYVHPDGFFQSPEVVADTLLGLKAFVPWEFADTHNPCRSIAPPLLVSGIAYLPVWATLALIPQRLLPLLLLVLPRLVMLALSLLIDLSVYRVYFAMGGGGDGLGPLLALALSWPMLVMQQQPFSNSIESVLVALSLLCYAEWRSSHTDGECGSPGARARTRRRAEVMLGAIAALGVFTRFTFLFYFFPVALMLLIGLVLETRSGRQRAALASFVRLAASFSMACAALVLLDSWYFGTGVQLTPLNSLLYNMDPRNLALHGIHARYTHLLVYLPMLFGPNALFSLLAIAFLSARAISARSFASRLLALFPACAHWAPSTISLVVALVPVSGVAFLSTAPHQEARFLLPCLASIALLSGDLVWGSRWRHASPSLSDECHQKPPEPPAPAAPNTAGSFSSSSASHRLRRAEVARPPPSGAASQLSPASRGRAHADRLLVWWILASIVFHLALAIFWGVAHQGGVVQASLVIGSRHRAIASDEGPASFLPSGHLVNERDGSQDVDVSTLIFFCTYMPPRHLLGIPKDSPLQVHDAHCDDARLLQVLAQVLVADPTTTTTTTSTSTTSTSTTSTSIFTLTHRPAALLVAPASVAHGHLPALLHATHPILATTPLYSLWPSFSGEHPPRALFDLRYEVLLVSA
eukprot:TRINITY_DN1265_c4_g1_i2.p1 TRINITY_DN1265_c4_g1~~TRINITY_DN1265_c4_g1_i2.p1  ORF type:complete len:660 (-),score=163.94 TRINITY_DN1265_c4_g1_i2:82-2061(-)